MRLITYRFIISTYEVYIRVGVVRDVEQKVLLVESLGRWHHLASPQEVP